MKLHLVPTKQFKKDLKRLSKTGFDLNKLEVVIDTLASGKHLQEKYHDHDLKGTFKNLRECHIAPDWLLRYQKDKENLLLVLIRTGTHRDVLGIE